MTPLQFVETYRPQAEAVQAATGIYADVLLAQWALETAWGGQMFNQNNLANIRCVAGIPCQGGFSQFPTLGDFVACAIATWHNGYYAGVLAATAGPAESLVVAIGASPWDAGHYNSGGGPGSALAPYFQEVLAVDPVVQAVTDLGNYLSTRLTNLKPNVGPASQQELDTILADATQILQDLKAVAVGGGLTPTQAASLAHIEQILTAGLIVKAA